VGPGGDPARDVDPVEVSEGSVLSRTEVFFVDASGRESAAREAVRIEVVTDGSHGEPLLIAFSRSAPALMARAA
jgi:hypothetical protein